MSNPFLNYPITQQDKFDDSVDPRRQITISQLLAFVTGVCVQLGITKLGFWIMNIDQLLIFNVLPFTGAGVVCFLFLNLSLLAPAVYYSKTWYFRTVLILFWIVVSLILGVTALSKTVELMFTGFSL